jgi:hypothetical protein
MWNLWKYSCRITRTIVTLTEVAKGEARSLHVYMQQPAYSSYKYNGLKWGCLRRRSAVACLLGLPIRILPEAWMSVSWECCVCWQVEVSAKGRLLVQKSPIEWVCVQVWFWNLNNEATKARVRLLRHNVASACELAELIFVAVYLVLAVHQFWFGLVMAWTPSLREQKTSLLRDDTWSRFVFAYWHFEVACESRLQRPRIRKKFRGSDAMIEGVLISP